MLVRQQYLIPSCITSTHTPPQTLCALSKSSQLHDGDLEWWMHYMIPAETLHLYFEKGFEVKPSEIMPSASHPNQNPGKGYFTTIKRSKGDYLCSFPGYWMASTVYPRWTREVKDSESYGFNFHQPNVKDGWPDIQDLIYVSHACPANRINSGKIDTEVRTPPPQLKTQHDFSCTTHT